MSRVRDKFFRADDGLSKPARLGPAILGAFVIAIVCLVTPIAPPDLGVDVSWSGVLSWAHEHGSQFGSQVVFTYGPLGYLLAPYALEATSISTIFISAALCFQIGFGLCLIGGRLSLPWRILFFAFFLLEAANAERRADLMLEAGIFCWGFLTAIESGRRQRTCVINFLLLAVFAALTKVNYFFVGGFSACALGIYFAAGRQGKPGCLILPGFLVCLLLAWIACGQSASNLPGFVRGAYLLSREYDQAAALEGLPALRLGGMFIGLTAFGTIVLHAFEGNDHGCRRALVQKTVLLGWVTGLLFAVWKHSMVRMERLHFYDLAVFGPTIGFVLAAMPTSSSQVRKLAAGLTLTCCLMSVVVVQSAFLPGIEAACAQVVSESRSHLEWLLFPAHSQRSIAEEIAARRKEAQLPIFREIVGSGSVDVFGFHQAHALLNGLNYHPRPVFQSYLAYNKELSRLNERFYLSPQAPEYVLFELAGLEHRFAALDDAPALAILLNNYRPLTNESGFLLLKRQSGSAKVRILATEGNFDMGARFDLRAFSGNDLWLELKVQPTWKGRIAKFLDHSPALRLALWETNSPRSKPILRRQAAPSVLESGFLCSPFFFGTEQILSFYETGSALRPAGLSVEPCSGTEAYWQRTVHFRLYRLEESGGMSFGKNSHKALDNHLH